MEDSIYNFSKCRLLAWVSNRRKEHFVFLGADGDCVGGVPLWVRKRCEDRILHSVGDPALGVQRSVVTTLKSLYLS